MINFGSISGGTSSQPTREQRRRRLALRWSLVVASTIILGASLTACDGDPEQVEPPVVDPPVVLRMAATHGDAAFTAVHGSAADDVWVVGADDGQGPVVLHSKGGSFEREATGVKGDLWWVHAVSPEEVYFAGSDSHILKYDGDGFERLSSPGLGKHIVFGIWASGPDDVYAVGAIAGRNGFIWHYDGSKFTELAIPSDFIREDKDIPPLFKVAGRSAKDIWIVGGDGAVMRGNKDDGFTAVPSGTDERLFTVHLDQKELLIVGGSSAGVLLSADLSSNNSDDVTLKDVTPEGAPLLQGVIARDEGTDWVTGRDGVVYVRKGDTFERFDTEVEIDAESLHAAWVAPNGEVWAAGGDVVTGTMDGGVVLHSDPRFELWNAPATPAPPSTCPEEGVDPEPTRSMARRWNEQLLGAIRRDVPRPTVHARNLLHTSIGMWDAWAAYDTSAKGVLTTEKETAENLKAARDEAIAYASYRILSHRYNTAVGGAVSQSCFDKFMEVLGYDPALEGTKGSSARALGNRVAEKVISTYAEDGANESENYADPSAFKPDQPPLIVDEPGVVTDDPTQWQHLLLTEAVTQNGISQEGGVREYVGAHWRDVTPFALVRAEPNEPYIAGANPPTTLNDSLVDAAIEVLRRTAELDIEDGELIDISPGAIGDNTLGTNDGNGRPENPITSEPYAPHMVLRGDFTRALAEFWADGPASETPPGHWNSLANQVADQTLNERRLFGSGPKLDPLSWDVHVYLALNGALHDAAIAAWELKRTYTTARPITLIRYLAGLGQSSDPDGPSYNADGIPLVADLIEVITKASSAPGKRHAHLARYEGDIAIRSWRGEPGDRDNEIGGVGWIRGVDWIPYQRRTFVTPEFPGYVSGHSTFSRAGAEVLTAVTGSEYFPGGLGTHEIPSGYLFFEAGPASAFSLQWGTYYDAADQAGQSRIWGGIHIEPDDFDGRIIGSQVGALALDLARSHFALP